DSLFVAIAVDQFAIRDDALEDRSAANTFEDLFGRAVDRDLDLVDTRIDQFLVTILEVKARRVRCRAHPDMLRARIPDHLEIGVAAHRGLAEPLDLDFDEAFLA